MFTLATTRFNNDTWNENCEYRDKNNIKGCIYGAPKQIKDEITLHVPMFVLEMNNDENKIMGIGLIRNAIVIGKKHSIYKDSFYNRYTYKGKYRIDCSELLLKESKIIFVLESLIFKGYHHLKRGQGITVVPDWITSSRKINFISLLKQMFCIRFQFY